MKKTELKDEQLDAIVAAGSKEAQAANKKKPADAASEEVKKAAEATPARGSRFKW